MTPIFFLLVYSVGCLLALIRHPMFGLYTYLFTFYMSPSHSWWGDEVPEIRYMFIVGLITFVSLQVHGSGVPRRSWLAFAPSKILLMLASFMWIQLLWALNFEVHLEGVINYTKHVVIFYVVFSLLDSPDRIRNFMLAHIVGCAWFGYLALDAGGGRLEEIGGPVGGANELGVHVSTALIVGGVFWLIYRGWPKILILVSLPLVANTLILTVSRGAFLGFFAAGGATGFFMPARFRKKFVGLSFLALVLLSMLAHDQLIERFVETWTALTTEEVEVDSSASSRLHIFNAGMEIGLDYPLGAGYRGTAFLSPNYMDASVLTKQTGQRSAHNTFAAVFAEHGFPGAVLYLAMVLWVVRTLFRTRGAGAFPQAPKDRAVCVAMGAALLGMYFSGNFSNNFFTETQYWLLACLCAQLAVSELAQVDAPAVDGKANLLADARETYPTRVTSS